jgi:hypothetical protein
VPLTHFAFALLVRALSMTVSSTGHSCGALVLLDGAGREGSGSALQRQYTGFVPVAAAFGSWVIRLLIIGSSASIFQHSRELPAAMTDISKKYFL